jgi:biopolymer transport protein ExbD
MGRFREIVNEDEGGGIDMSPMIDCVFILLIFFIVTTTFVEETGVEVDKPQAASSVQLEKNSILLALTAGGDVVYGGKNIGIQGVQQLVRRMVQREKDDELPVILQADSAAPSGMLIRIVDEAKLGGAKRVNVSTARATGRG